MMIVWTFFRSDAGTDGAIIPEDGVEAAGRRVLGSEEVSAVFDGS
jgi:hypothetical protein